jgi:hypothetical protein
MHHLDILILALYLVYLHTVSFILWKGTLSVHTMCNSKYVFFFFLVSWGVVRLGLLYQH